eukprot:CAMPEP_0167752630 /NCGR_PEP_ID=MMETSP0110_2-20121227/7246_1 /TAXON_ID=629695 /ORGANISM="Gymnochlora sp., Strain CCMP2014" /LENGTH=276 /DNA_ID=CAMNT_0007638269 /DNA_START=509 /DNA_END=1339 /DNA_ORIENTATION=-
MALYNKLNGRYNNKGQYNSPLTHLSYTEDGSYFIEYKNGGQEWCGLDIDKSDLYSLGKLISVSVGPNGSYVIVGAKNMIWDGVPERMEQLLMSRTQRCVGSAQLGYNGSYYLEYCDGKMYFEGLPNSLTEVLEDEKYYVEHVVLDPDSYNYYCKTEKGRIWVGPMCLTNHLTADLRLSPAEIFFSNSSIKSEFSDGNCIFELAKDLEYGIVSAEDIELIRVVRVDGCFHSLDNRRLKAFKLAGLDSIPVQILPAHPTIVGKIYRLRDYGRTIKIRN